MRLPFFKRTKLAQSLAMTHDDDTIHGNSNSDVKTAPMQATITNHISDTMHGNEQDIEALSTQIYSQIFGFRTSFLFHLAAIDSPEHQKLALLDIIGEEPLTLQDISKLRGWNEARLLSILHGLAAIGILHHTSDHRFTLTPLGKVYRESHLLRLEAFLAGKILAPAAFGGLIYALETGEGGFEHVFGTNFYDYLGSHPQYATTFGQYIGLLTKRITPIIVGSYDFGKAEQIVDVGGGDGTLLVDILTANPAPKGIIVDKMPMAISHIASVGLSDRCQVVTNDFMQEVPNGDLFIIMQILHDFSDEQCIKILSICLKSMNKQGKLLIIEQILEDPITHMTPAVGQHINMNFLLNGGQERTEIEYRELLGHAGFEVSKVIPLKPTPFSIIEAIKNPQSKSRLNPDPIPSK
jgi:hypothetical protein